MWEDGRKNLMFFQREKKTLKSRERATSTFGRKRDEPIAVHASSLSCSDRDWTPRNYAILIVVGRTRSTRARRITTNCNKALRRTHRREWFALTSDPPHKAFTLGSYDISCNCETPPSRLYPPLTAHALLPSYLAPPICACWPIRMIFLVLYRHCKGKLNFSLIEFCSRVRRFAE